MRQRLNAMQEDMVPAASAKWITVLVLILEDLPQLVLNCIYIDTMGSNGADGISVFSVMMTVFGIIFNVLMVCCGGIFWGDRHDAETMEDDGIMGFILACCGCGSSGSFFT